MTVTQTCKQSANGFVRYKPTCGSVQVCARIYDNYIRKCSQLCPDYISRLLDDISTSVKIQTAVSLFQRLLPGD